MERMSARKSEEIERSIYKNIGKVIQTGGFLFATISLLQEPKLMILGGIYVGLGKFTENVIADFRSGPEKPQMVDNIEWLE